MTAPVVVYKIVRRVIYRPGDPEKRPRRISPIVRDERYIQEYKVLEWTLMTKGPSFVFVDEQCAWNYFYSLDTYSDLEFWKCHSEQEPVPAGIVAQTVGHIHEFWMIKAKCPETQEEIVRQVQRLAQIAGLAPPEFYTTNKLMLRQRLAKPVLNDNDSQAVLGVVAITGG